MTFLKKNFILTMCLALSGCATTLDWLRDGTGNYSPSGKKLSYCPTCGERPVEIMGDSLKDKKGHIWILK